MRWINKLFVKMRRKRIMAKLQELSRVQEAGIAKGFAYLKAAQILSDKSIVGLCRGQYDYADLTHVWAKACAKSAEQAFDETVDLGRQAANLRREWLSCTEEP